MIKEAALPNGTDSSITTIYRTTIAIVSSTNHADVHKKCTDQNSTSSYTCYKGTSTNARSSVVLFVSGSGHAGVAPKSRMVMVAGFRGLAWLGFAWHYLQ
eukprot:CAMPEP_0172410706 /NCGR_PEP_ID=MMETSP1061-20121228/77021_1 /TAXON_ID=37318 /ORGANISM="Pseudo-nitzschia pungens, Strain cf. pungens" /LENGTH=99 /DNA_ID=CAMNT_0013146899 /DNA_START=96 /DNA_END=395 /DNA_ORIENTATION=-